MMRQDVARRVKNQLDELRWGPVIVHKSMSTLFENLPSLVGLWILSFVSVGFSPFLSKDTTSSLTGLSILEDFYG